VLLDPTLKMMGLSPMAVAPKHQHKGFASVFLYKTFEETFGRPAISSELQKHVNNLTVLIYITPQIVLTS
jgi:hypothetical protein